MKKKTLLITMLIALTTAFSAPAQESASVSFSGPSSWTPGTSITLSVQDTFSNLIGGGSSGLDYFLEVNSAIAPFLSITNLNYFTFGVGGPPLPVPGTPILFDASGSSGFMRERMTLGGVNNPPLVPNGSYHVTDITFTLAAGAPNGTYTLRATPQSSQADGNFNDVPIPQSPFAFAVVPEPSARALLGIGAIGSGVLIYRRRKHRDGRVTGNIH